MINLKERIYAAKEAKKQENRPHLGASVVGHNCARYIWYSFRWYRKPEFPGRILRIFETGHQQEERLIDDLRKAGYQVVEKDKDGKQYTFSAFGGHFRGSIDGIIKGHEIEKWSLLECKSAKSSSFNQLVKNGLALANPRHMVQIQTYMGCLKFSQAIYVCVNKENEEIYSEVVDFDREMFDLIIQRVQEIIFSSFPLEKINDSLEWYECKMCEFLGVCKGSGQFPETTCRSCDNVICNTNGLWQCDSTRKYLSIEDQKNGCSNYRELEEFPPF